MNTTTSGFNSRSLLLTLFLGVATLLSACNGDGNGAMSTANSVAASGNGGNNGDEVEAGDSSALSYRRDCFWAVRFDPDLVNTLYPDKYAIYWLAAFVVPPGSEVQLKGQYPHARYMSLNAYDPSLAPVDVLADINIVPDEGSLNPFLVGADRQFPARDYSVRIVAETLPESPEEREPNTLYSQVQRAGLGIPSNLATVIYRIYLPDEGRDLTGDVGLPQVVVKLADGQELQGSEACSALTPFEPNSTTLADLTAEMNPLLPLETATGFKDMMWMKFFSLPQTYASRFHATPLGEVLYDSPLNDFTGGGFASNMDNSYIYSILAQSLVDDPTGHGAVAAFEATFPEVPGTLSGESIMADGDMRYWSMCTYEAETQRWLDCVYDEEAVGQPGNRYVFTVTAPEDRPANATPECGVNWLPWGPTDLSVALLRQMLPKDDYPNAIRDIEARAGTCEAQRMQRAYPYGQHMTKAEFETLGCPVNPDAIPDRATQYPPREEDSCYGVEPTGEIFSPTE